MKLTINKKVIPILLITLMLSGCVISSASFETPDENPSSQAEENQTIDDIEDLTESLENDAKDFLFDNSEIFYHVAYNDKLSELAPTPEGLYILRSIYAGSVNLFYVDVKSCQEVFVCNQPNCTHSDDSCTSYISVPGGLNTPSIAYYDGYLYLIRAAADENQNACIFKMNSDGTQRQKLCEFDSNVTLGMYIFGYKNSLILDTTYVDTNGKIKESLTLVDTQYGYQTELMSLSNIDTESFVRPCGCWSKYLVFSSMESGKTISLFLVDPSDEQRTISDWIENKTLITFDQMSANAYVKENYLCAINRDSCIVSITDLSSGEKKECKYEKKTEGVPGVGYLFDGLVSISFLNENSEERFLFDVNSGSLKELSFTNAYTNGPYILLGVYGEQLLFKTGYSVKPLHDVQNSAITEGSIYVEKMCILSKTDYLNDVHNEIPIINAL